MKKIKRSKWLSIAIILAIAFVIDVFIPDPLPFVDEVLLMFASLFSLYKSFKKKRR